MIVIRKSRPVVCDVDDTLIMWNPSDEDLAKHGIKMTVTLPDGSEFTDLVLPHKTHIKQIIKHKLRGHPVIVWSAGGWEWAERAVWALGLEPYVDIAMEKPAWSYDDLPPEKFMPKSQWLEDK